MTQTIPAPAPAPVSPPTGAGGGFSPPTKGGLSIGVIASIQGVYLREERKRLQLQGKDTGLGLQPGWGGQGT